MADVNTSHPTAGRRRKQKSPPVLHDSDSLPLPRLELGSDAEKDLSDGDGEKGAKRQKSEPTTPVSTSSRQPHEYDAIMGITRVGTKEADRFEEDSDLVYHDATEESLQHEPREGSEPVQPSENFHGGFGSESLKECIELLNATVCNSPATLHSGVGYPKPTGPQQVVSPTVEESPTAASAQPSGSISLDATSVKEEPPSRNDYEREEARIDTNLPTLDVKDEHEEPERKEENDATPVKQEEHTPRPDSEDSLTAERVAEELQQLSGMRTPMVSAQTQSGTEEGASAPRSVQRERATAPVDSREQAYGPQASQGAGRRRGRLHSPDPVLFSDTIWMNHDQEASVRRGDDPMRQVHERLMCMEHNLETLRTRVTQVADLRDAQGIREDNRTIVARLNEVEEHASANTLREFMMKIQRLESMLVGDNGGAVREAIRVYNRRIDHQQASLDDVRARIRAQNWHHELSDQEEEDEKIWLSTRNEDSDPFNWENRPADRRRRGGLPPQLRFRSPMPRPPPPPPPVTEPSGSEPTQQAVQRLFVAYNQCVTRANHIEDRLEQFRAAVHRDATELALTVHRTDHGVKEHHQGIRQLTESLEEVHIRLKSLDEYYQEVVQHEHHVNQTIDRNTHSLTNGIYLCNHCRAGRH